MPFHLSHRVLVQPIARAMYARVHTSCHMPQALTFRDHFDHMKRRKPLYPQFLAQFAGKMQSKSFYKRFVGNVHMYGSQSFLDMPISEFVTFPRWSSWLSADYRMINEVKFSICKVSKID